MRRPKLYEILIILLIFYCFFLVFTARPVKGEEYSFYNVEVVRVYDGDTITVNLPIQTHPLFDRELPIRGYGYDTPEIRGRCLTEKIIAQIAREEVKATIELYGNKVDLLRCERGKYFRLVCEIVINGVDIGRDLIHKNLAYPYDGKAKAISWCPEEEKTK